MSRLGFFHTVSRRLFSSKPMTKSVTNNLRFDWSPEEIKQQAEEIMSASRAVLDTVGSLNSTSILPESVIKALNDMQTAMSVKTSSIEFLQNVSASREVRDASRDADKLLSDFWVEASMRTDVFGSLVALQAKVDKKEVSLSPEEERFLEHEILDGKRNGLHLGSEIRSQVEEIKKRISKLSIDFSTNIAEENTFLLFSKEELEGCQPDLIESLEEIVDESDTSSKKLKVTLQYPHYIPVMRDCTVRSTRRALELKFNSRCKEVNLDILCEIVELRDKKAKLLGYTNHADFITEKRMAKTAKTVDEFLSNLRDRIAQVGMAKKDKALLKKYRTEVMGISESEPFENCDTAFLRNLVEKNEFSVDHAKIQKFFPFEHVTREMLDVYSTLLGLKFTSVTESQPRWHEDVVCYKVTDSEDDNHIVGYFYMDMFPREGKFSHAALFPLQPSMASQIGVCSLVCNFPKPMKDKPSLLTHDDVTTYFHEFGHCMHHLCSEKVTLSAFAGTNVERDFVECPSQMLENWCWEPEIIKKLSCHVDTKEPLSDELVDQLVKSRHANEGIATQRQLAFALFDQKLHGGTKWASGNDITQLYVETYSESTGFTPTPGTSMPASFGHLCGYDAQYYGYLWAEVFSADMFVSKFANGRLLSPLAGKEYREKVLAVGGSIDAGDILRGYLKREPTMDAFFKLKGM